MENIEVHSKDFVIRWTHAAANTRVSWNVMPIKRSINFGVFQCIDSAQLNESVAEATGPLTERLTSAGFTPVLGNGLARIDPRNPNEGNLRIDNACMLGFVFDNTFSISNGKHVQFSFTIAPISGGGTSGSSSGNQSELEVPVRRNDLATAAAHSALAARSSASILKNHDSTDSLSSSAASAAVSAAPNNNTSTPSLSRQPTRKQSLNSVKDTQVNSNKPRRRGTMSSTSTFSSVAFPPVPSNGNAGMGISTDQKPESVDDDVASSLASRNRPGGTSSISSVHVDEPIRSLDNRFTTGFLQKKRRKQFQGFARRYFSLDKRTGLLNYYLNQKSSSLRGVMPIRIAHIKCDPKKSLLFLDSGMEKWTLKASNSRAFELWKLELKEVQSEGKPDESELESEEEIALTPTSSASGVGSHLDVRLSAKSVNSSNTFHPKESSKSNVNSEGPFSTLDELRHLISKVSDNTERSDLQRAMKKLESSTMYSVRSRAAQGTPNRARSFAKALYPRKALKKVAELEAAVKPRRSSLPKPVDTNDFVNQVLSKNFFSMVIIILAFALVFGLKVAVCFILMLTGAMALGLLQFGPITTDESENGRQLSSSQSSTSSNGSELGAITSSPSISFNGSDSNTDEEEDYHASSEESEEESEDSPNCRRTVAYVPQRPSYDTEALSAISQQYRNEGGSESIHGSEDPEVAAAFNKLADENQLVARSAGSKEGTKAREACETDEALSSAQHTDSSPKAESAETSLYPLPHAPVNRRTQVPGPVQPPPSLMSLLKNAKSGNATAPIISNEPLSGVETLAEFYENSDLLSAASKAPPKSNLRVMLVALFAVSRLSCFRNKERILRKPFTPLLGETYEMVREDGQFRFVAEKIMHKPEIVASQAESPHWTVHFTSRPHSKLWAKSMQISDIGVFNVTFPDGEGVSFTNPEMFVRNILAGERYVEPVGSMTVESSADPHLTAQVDFKAGGMFSGRSEEVKISSGKMVYEGKWTQAIYHQSKMVWTAKPLVDQATKHYGFTVFDSQLNEITKIEDGNLPPNDSRLRPDLRLYEKQTDVENAERIKLRLEQQQRERRKKFESEKKEHEPYFFVKSQGSKGLYVLRTGDRNYWVKRQTNDWHDIPNYFE